MRKELIDLIDRVGLTGKAGEGVFKGFFGRMNDDAFLQLEMMLSLMKVLIPSGLKGKLTWEYADQPDSVELNWELMGVKDPEPEVQQEVVGPITD